MVCSVIYFSTVAKRVSDPADEDDHGPANNTAAEDTLEGDMWGDPDIPINAEGEFDDEDDDDILEAPTGGKPSMLPQPDRVDEDGNHFVTIVDVSGIHHLPVLFCACDTRLTSRHCLPQDGAIPCEL